MLSPVTYRRLKRFFSIKRAWISLLVLLFLFVISLFSEFIANDKPILIRYENKFYLFSAFIFYSDSQFGGLYNTEAQYKKLEETDRFKNNKKNYMVFPPIRFGPYYSDLEALNDYPPTAPDKDHILGTDDRGRDVFARLLYGFRVSMFFSLILLIIEIIIGVIIGGLQGYYAGYFDVTLQRFIEILSSLPSLYIIIIIGNIFGKSLITLVFIMSIFNWIGISYYIRSEFLHLRNYQFVEAARAIGQRNFSIIISEILPNALTPIVTFVPFSIIAGISALTSLDYLGFGLPAPTPSWGELIKQGMDNLSSYWLSVFPIFALFVTLLLNAFVGEGIREAVDPKQTNNMR